MERYVRTAAAEAYATVPCYRWIYDKKGINPDIDDIPVISKQDLFDYEDETGNPYYLSPRIGPDPVLAYTSGTTGRMLSVPVTNRDQMGTEYVMHAVEAAAQPVLQGAPSIVWIPRELPAYMLSMNIQPEQVSARKIVVISGKQPINDQVQQAKDAGVTIIFDLPGTIAGQLISNELPDDHGIKVLCSTYFPEDVVKALAARGITTLFWYVAMDSLVGHLGCLHTAPNEFHIRSTRSHHEVLLSDGSVSGEGRGKYVSTIPDLPFPVVRYTNMDTVELVNGLCPCGYQGTSLKFLGRDNSFKLGTGPVLNMEAVFRYVAAQPGVRRVVLVTARTSSSQGHGYVFVMTEHEDLTSSLCERGPSPDIHKLLYAGFGGSDDEYAGYVFWVKVKTGTMPVFERDRKPRVFINLTSGSVLPEFEGFVRLIEESTGESVVLNRK